jgi:uncharacterized protein
MSIVAKVREIVKNDSGEWDWKYHITPVVRYSLELAEKLDADIEPVEIGALLHDIGRIRFNPKDHEITGISEAEKILKALNYPDEKIEEIKHIVESHRGSGTVKPKTLAAKIVANADAMAHFAVIPAMMQIALKVKEGDLVEAFDWIDKKVERDWEAKLTLPEARELMEGHYRAIRLLFDSMKEYL